MSHLRQRATAIVMRDGFVLLVRDKGKPQFSLPGGGINRGEPSTSAAAREVYEELGIRPTKIVRLRDCDYRGSVNIHRVCLIEADGEPYMRGHELVAFVWWDMKKEIPVHPHVREILRKLPKELIG